MVIFSSTALVVQLIKLAIFFISLGLPAAPGPATILTSPALTAALHDVDRPPSNPRRKRG